MDQLHDVRAGGGLLYLKAVVGLFDDSIQVVGPTGDISKGAQRITGSV
jgi:hypothetical protein